MAIELADREGQRPSSCWDPDVDSILTCIDVHAETHDVKSFTFRAPEGKSIHFTAGQYFLFEPDIDGEENGRCYSISSSPLRAGAITVTVKRVAGGKVSNWMHDSMQVGMEIKASGPLGRFVRPPAPSYLFLSGGSGITPVMSMLRELADRLDPVDVVFLHAGRSPQDLVFREELSLLARRMKGLRLFFLPEDISTERSWHGVSGRISAELLALAVPDISRRVVMCCGPAPFMAAARSICGSMGVPETCYIEESFDAAAIEDVLFEAHNGETVATFEVSFSKQGRSISVPADQTVLSQSKKAGIRIPSSCANGICGTCKSKLTSGRVDMQHGGGIRQREIDAGLFLPCCSKPLSDLVIER
ncbi:hybrid-cluster NAD(P)-dependent oxidoreductase [Peteryoungia ipomoeae]|uniref:Hybrid-cluster NAD(P)-dependent oxidoreductase n=1 Tax=Peteryoungia ipomoeae TaxID=1210932 RepID=A0A4S8P1Y7_9HYPH|nr:hybrid-cluster NAD(P)-dependent oxidoreductase [Peteryoungia ipomoeae]THV24053.1 hybrid-cluster NAD(P)-dependent oxidoreductase [Peteryoungia ipomoeae]